MTNQMVCSSFLQVAHKLGKSPTRDDINLMVGMKSNNRRYLVTVPTADNNVPSPAKGRSNLATHPDTVCTAGGQKSSNVYNDKGGIDEEIVPVLYGSDGATVKTASTNISHYGESRKKRHPILQDPFSGIQVCNEVPLDEEGTCCSRKDDDDMDEAMDDGPNTGTQTHKSNATN
jgi:hypothetical protein